jgi:hypothetical protein
VTRSDTLLGTGDIWVLAVNPASTYGTTRAQKVSGSANLIRTEPEWLVTSQDAYIMYTARAFLLGNPFVRRAASGL